MLLLGRRAHGDSWTTRMRPQARRVSFDWLHSTSTSTSGDRWVPTRDRRGRRVCAPPCFSRTREQFERCRLWCLWRHSDLIPCWVARRRRARWERTRSVGSLESAGRWERCEDAANWSPNGPGWQRALVHDSAKWSSSKQRLVNVKPASKASHPAVALWRVVEELTRHPLAYEAVFHYDRWANECSATLSCRLKCWHFSWCVWSSLPAQLFFLLLVLNIHTHRQKKQKHA